MNVDEKQISEAIRKIFGITPDLHDEVDRRPLYDADKVAKLLGYEKGIEDPEVVKILSEINPDNLRYPNERVESMVNFGDRSIVSVCKVCGWRGPRSYFGEHNKDKGTCSR